MAKLSNIDEKESDEKIPLPKLDENGSDEKVDENESDEKVDENESDEKVENESDEKRHAQSIFTPGRHSQFTMQKQKKISGLYER